MFLHRAIRMFWDKPMGVPSSSLNIQRPVETWKEIGPHTAVPEAGSDLCLAPADTGNCVLESVDLDNFEIPAHVRNVAR